MRFASLQSSNTGDYAAAGKQAADSLNKSFKIARESGPNYQKLAETAMVTQAEENIASMNASAKVTNAAVDAYADVTQKGYDAKLTKYAADKKDKVRKAGAIAGLGAIAGTAYLATRDNEEGRERPKDTTRELYEAWLKNHKGIKDRHDQERSELGDGPEYTPYNPSSSTGGGSGGKVNGGGADVSPQTSQSSLTGNQKIVADAIAKYESGDWGYEAFNQGGAAGGTQVVGKSGSHKNTFGRSLTDMTLGEIFHKQNTKQRGLSFQQHLDQGGLHAVGRYQFIGSTLQDEVNRMGLDLNTKFTPQVQDAIFLSHIKRVGDISPWVGPSNNYSSSQKANFRNLISQF